MNTKTAGIRLYRAGIEAAGLGNLQAAETLIKTGYYIEQGYDPNDVINNMFPKEQVKTAGEAIGGILSAPSIKTPNVDIQKIIRFLHTHPDLIGAGIGTAAGGALGYQRNGLLGAGLSAAAGGGGGYLLGKQLKPQ